MALPAPDSTCTPKPLLKAMVLSAPGLVPPIRLLLELLSTTPLEVLGIEPRSVALAPIRLPWIVVPWESTSSTPTP